MRHAQAPRRSGRRSTRSTNTTSLSSFIPRGNPLSDVLRPDESFLSPLVAFPTETTFQVARLIYDGFFDEHDFDVVLPHMGGTLLHLAGRIDRGRQEIDDPTAPPAGARHP